MKVRGSSSTQMAPFIRESGPVSGGMAWEPCSSQMVGDTKATGKMIEFKVKERCFTLMAADILVTGTLISKTEQGYNTTLAIGKTQSIVTTF